MKKLITILILCFSGITFAWDQRPPQAIETCKVHAPYGFPQSSRNLIGICRQAYFVGYDAPSKIPEYVTYTLLPQNALGCVARTNAFAADKSIVNGPVPDDYAGTGYDKGHVSPDGDLSWDQQVEYESFLMTNMLPQAGSLNRGIWKLLETSIRGWAVQLNQSFTIIGGGIYNTQDKKIGSGVVVPHAFYKIVINNKTGQVAGWLFPHTAPYPNLGNDLTLFRVSVDHIQQRSGIKLHFSPNAVELKVGQEWPVDFGKLTNDKRVKCKGSKDKDD